MMDWSKNIRRLQIDLSSYCNAKCGACMRNEYGDKTRPGLKLSHFDIKVWDRLFRVDLANIKLEEVTLNGNWGDACMHPKLPEMLGFVAKIQPYMQILIATNGSMQSPDWWKKLGISLATNPNTVDFAVDGLEDTHAIYRRGTDFNKIMLNMKAFISGGGNAQWVMTEFDHNRHQVDESIERAAAIGAVAFVLRQSHEHDMLIDTKTENYLITTSKCSGKSYELRLNESNDARQIALTENDVSTNCPWYNEGEIQIDPWGNVHPCCHISTFGNGVNTGRHFWEEWPYEDRSKQYGDFNNANIYTLQEILEHKWYSTELEDAVKDDYKWPVCSRNCGDGSNTDIREG